MSFSFFDSCSLSAVLYQIKKMKLASVVLFPSRLDKGSGSGTVLVIVLLFQLALLVVMYGSYYMQF